MSAKSATSRARKPSRKPAASKAARQPNPKTGKLPEWNLADLYSGIDAAEVTRDLQKMDADCAAFETDYKGKLAERVAGDDGGHWLAEAVRRYEAIDDLAGRLGSYAGLIHAGDSVDPAISKFYGDVSERLTAASVHLLFFALGTQPHRRCRDRARDADAGARPLPAVDRGSAQGQAVSARRSRRAVVSRKIPERLCRLEPAVRPDHLRPALQGRRQGTGDRADAESAAGPRAGEAQGGGAGAGQDLQGQ